MAQTAASSPEPARRSERVTPLELFFDLVFVFTITQLAQLLADHFTPSSLWHITVMLGLIFWMYDGYAWLTNAILSRGTRVEKVLLAGMASYLVLAIAIPDAFSGTGLTFGIAYLLINAIHAYLYMTEAGDGAAKAMKAIAPINLGTATAVLISGAVGGLIQELVWTAVVLVFVFGARPGDGFEIGPAHFVERHGLLVLIAIGESVVASGAAARTALIGHPLDLGVVLVVLLGLCVSSVLWWTYFADGDEKLEKALGSLTAEEKVRAGLWGFGYAHYVMLLGVIVTSVGIRFAVVDPGGRLGLGAAFALSGGVTVFLAGDGWFRRTLKLTKWGPRELGALAVLVAVPVTTLVNTDAGLALTAVIGTLAVGRERGYFGVAPQ